jgi:hypothetical protein
MKSAALILGWILTILGGCFALVFGLFTLFYLGCGGYGIIIAFGMTGPACLAAMVALALGIVLKDRAQRITTVDRSKSASFPHSANHPLSTGETVMTNQASRPSDSPQPPNDDAHGVYNPITLEDVQSADTDPFFTGLDKPFARNLGAILFIVIFFLANRSPAVAPVLLVILLACLLYRMSERERAIAAVPLTLSSVLLASELAGPLGFWGHFMSYLPRQVALSNAETGLSWLPLFFSACLFFTPSKRTHTSRVVFWYSFALLLSGLLPGMGYLFIAGLLYYTLFVAIFISLLLDLQPQLAVPRPLAASPQPARA